MATGKPVIGIIGPREPYEKPEVKLIDVGNLLDVIEGQESELYKSFNTLGDKLEAFVAALEGFEAEMTGLSERLDKLKNDHAKVQFLNEVRAREDYDGA